MSKYEDLLEEYENSNNKTLKYFFDTLVNQIVYIANEEGIESINFNDLSYNSYRNNKNDNFNLEELKKEFNINNLKLELLDYYDGYENGPNDIYYILKVIIDNKTYYIKGNGYYDSWDGSEWENEYEFVKPVEKTIIVYETTKTEF